MLTSSEISSPPDIMINSHDPIQNLGQTRISYKAGQTWLTRAKRNLVDPDDPIWLQRCLISVLVITIQSPYKLL